MQTREEDSLIVYLNGRFLPQSEARVSLLDRGFLYGDGLFETMRAYGGRVFRVLPHLERLRRAADALGFAPQLPVGSTELLSAIEELLRRNRLPDAYVRLTVSRGPGLGPDAPEGATPTVTLIARPLHLLPEAAYQRGGSLVSVVQSPSPLARLKTLNYLDKIVARQRAKAQGADDALLVNPKGFLLEASASNIFLVESGALLTPDEQAGLLPGITRAAALELAAGLGLAVQMIDLPQARLAQADECFLTNSIVELMPVCAIDRQPIGGGSPGPITERLREAYRDLVAGELGLKRSG